MQILAKNCAASRHDSKEPCAWGHSAGFREKFQKSWAVRCWSWASRAEVTCVDACWTHHRPSGSWIEWSCNGSKTACRTLENLSGLSAREDICARSFGQDRRSSSVFEVRTI